MNAGDLVQTHVGSTIAALVTVISYKDYNTYYFLLSFYSICVYNHKGRLIIGSPFFKLHFYVTTKSYYVNFWAAF